MRVLLVHPEERIRKYDFKGIIENECLDLEYLAAVLAGCGHEITIWDGKIESVSFEEVLEKSNPEAVYYTGRIFQEHFLLKYAKMAKARNPHILTVIGGLHAQICFERMYRPYVDIILKSFDVFKVPVLLENAGDIVNKIIPDEIAGMNDICYHKGTEWVSNPVVPFDINRLPRPDRTYFYNHPENYNYLDLPHAAWVRTAYSCPYRCKFCTRNRMNAGKYSRRDIADVVDEIAEIQAENIYIVDDDFLYDEERIRTFIRLIRAKKIKKCYICYGRSDFIAAHEDLVKALGQIGFYYFLVGLESIREADMSGYNKRNTLENNEKSVSICHRHGVHMMALFIVDLDFKRRDFHDLYRWIKAHKLKHVAVSIYTPEPGLESFAEYKDTLLTDDMRYYDYLHLVCKPKNLPVGEYYREYYLLLIRLFMKAKREGVYDFIDYGYYIRTFWRGFFGLKGKKNERNK